MESLGVVDAEPAQELERGLVLHALGDRGSPEAAGHFDDRLYGHPVGRGAGDLLDELAVDLERVERQVLQVVEGPESRPEVIEHDLAAEGGESPG